MIYENNNIFTLLIPFLFVPPGVKITLLAFLSSRTDCLHFGASMVLVESLECVEVEPK